MYLEICIFFLVGIGIGKKLIQNFLSTGMFIGFLACLLIKCEIENDQVMVACVGHHSPLTHDCPPDRNGKLPRQLPDAQCLACQGAGSINYSTTFLERPPYQPEKMWLLKTRVYGDRFNCTGGLCARKWSFKTIKWPLIVSSLGRGIHALSCNTVLNCTSKLRGFLIGGNSSSTNTASLHFPVCSSCPFLITVNNINNYCLFFLFAAIYPLKTILQELKHHQGGPVMRYVCTTVYLLYTGT